MKTIEEELIGKRAYWEMRRISTVDRSNSSKKGRAARPSYAGCMPASSCQRRELGW